jgi:molybdate transport system ATP-binding protein
LASSHKKAFVEVNVSKTLFGSDKELKLEADFKIAEGEFIALMGESGSGKSSLLRVLAGVESAEGTIFVDDEVWLDGKYSIPPQKREVGLVFQDYALFENMSVIENLLFVSKDRELANYLLDVTELKELRDRYPKSLSGGQKQRVALARAVMRRPKLLLMDEPLSALDNKMRIKLQEEIKFLHRKFDMTTMMVSHDIAEVHRLADRVLLLERGKIVLKRDTKNINTKSELKLKAEVVDRRDNLTLLSVCGTILKVETELLSDVGEVIELSVDSSDFTIRETE